MRKSVTLIIISMLAAGSAFAAVTGLVVGVETWPWQGAGDPTAYATTNNGASGSLPHNGNWQNSWNIGSDDGTFGTIPGADTTVATNYSSGGWINRGNTNDFYVDFIVKATLTSGVDLQAFHFDARGLTNSSSYSYSLEVLSGTITTGFVAAGVIPVVTNHNLADFDIDLTGLADHQLGHLVDTTFRLNFSGGTLTNEEDAVEIDNVALTGITDPLPIPYEELIAGWEYWYSSGSDVASRVSNNVSAVYTDIQHSIHADSAQTDGTWGSFVTGVPADTNNVNTSDGTRMPNGISNTYTFAVTDLSGSPRYLGGFHFDSGCKRPKAANEWTLTVLPGSSITTGLVAEGVVPNITGGVIDWQDIDIYLTHLDDYELDANSTVTFQLHFSGGIPGSGGHDQTIDNVAITSTTNEPVVPPPVDLSNAITAFSFNPGGTSSLSFTGGVSSAYVINSTDDLTGVFSPVTLDAVTVGTQSNSTIVITTGAGDATVEFTEADTNQYYQVESVD